MTRSFLASLALLLVVLFACHEPTAVTDTATTSNHPTETNSDTAIQTATTGSVGSSPGCSYFTEADATLLFNGHPMRYRAGANTENRCTIEPADGDVTTAATIEYQVSETPQAYDTVAGQKDAEPLRALGDKAVWSEGLGQVVLVKGSREFSARLQGLTSEKRKLKERAEELARRAATRM